MGDSPVKRRLHPDLMLARAQIVLTFVLLSAIISMLVGLIFFRNVMTDKTVSTVTNLLMLLGTLLTLSWNYFFARQRPAALPDPNTTTTVTTPTAPGDPNAPLTTSIKITPAPAGTAAQ